MKKRVSYAVIEDTKPKKAVWLLLLWYPCNILLGLTRLSSGNAYLNGFHIEKEQLQAKKQSGLVSQSINLDRELTPTTTLVISTPSLLSFRAKRGILVFTLKAGSGRNL